jgi:flagellar protein FliS
MNYAIESATGITPVGMVVRLYENIASDLGRAILALRDGDIEKRTIQLQHALLLISHLQNALDIENGGEPAQLLGRLYDIARHRILEAQVSQSGTILEEVMHDFLSVRDAWAQVEKHSEGTGPSTSATSNPEEPSNWIA